MQPGLGCGGGLGWLTCAGKLWRSRSPCGAAMATWMWGGLHNAFAVLEIWEDSNCTALYSFEAPVKQECHRSFSLPPSLLDCICDTGCKACLHGAWRLACCARLLSPVSPCLPSAALGNRTHGARAPGRRLQRWLPVSRSARSSWASWWPSWTRCSRQAPSAPQAKLLLGIAAFQTYLPSCMSSCICTAPPAGATAGSRHAAASARPHTRGRLHRCPM